MQTIPSNGPARRASASAVPIRRAFDQPVRAIALIILAAVLALTGAPMLSGSAEADQAGTDLTDLVKTEVSYQALAEDGTWVDSDPGQVRASIEDGTAMMKAVLTWTLEDGVHTVSNGDHFAFTMDQIAGGGSSVRL